MHHRDWAARNIKTTWFEQQAFTIAALHKIYHKELYKLWDTLNGSEKWVSQYAGLQALIFWLQVNGLVVRLASSHLKESKYLAALIIALPPPSIFVSLCNSYGISDTNRPHRRGPARVPLRALMTDADLGGEFRCWFVTPLVCSETSVHWNELWSELTVLWVRSSARLVCVRRRQMRCAQLIWFPPRNRIYNLDRENSKTQIA